MAYVDQNGLVLIDELEALEDIKKLNTAKDLLAETVEFMNQISSVNSTFQGDTANAIELVSLELVNKIKEQMDGIDEEILFINNVVDRYRSIDSGMKNQINSTLN